MLQREAGPTVLVGFLVAIELEKSKGDLLVEQVRLALAGAANFMEGVGTTDVEVMGELEVIQDKENNDPV